MDLWLIPMSRKPTTATPCDLAVAILAPLDALLHVLDVTEDPR